MTALSLLELPILDWFQTLQNPLCDAVARFLNVIAANGEVSASVNVSAQSGNIIEAKADGIYAGVEWQTLA